MPHYTAKNPKHRRCRVFLGGVEMRDVIECDTDEGWLIKFQIGPDGKPVLSSNRAHILRERLTGSVRVET